MVQSYGPGDWSIGGYRLPEFGITEAFGEDEQSVEDAKVRTQMIGGTQAQEVPAPDTSDTTDGGGTTTTGGGTDQPQTQTEGVDETTQEQIEAQETNKEAMMRMIENEYSGIMSDIGTQEDLLESNKQALERDKELQQKQVGEEAKSAQAQLQEGQAEDISSLESQAFATREAKKRQVGQARRLFNELKTGVAKFSGSAREAYGEMLSRSTAQNVGRLRTQAAKTLQDIRSEKGRVKQFYNRKVTEVEQNKNNAMQELRNDFNKSINDINIQMQGLGEQKVQAKKAKANERLQALADFQVNTANIREAAAVAKRSIQQWAAERTSALDEAETFTAQEFRQQLAALAKNESTEQLAATYGAKMSPYIGQEIGPQFREDLQGVYTTTGTDEEEEDSEFDWRNVK